MELGGEISRGGCKSLEGVSAWEWEGTSTIKIGQEMKKLVFYSIYPLFAGS